VHTRKYRKKTVIRENKEKLWVSYYYLLEFQITRSKTFRSIIFKPNFVIRLKKLQAHKYFLRSKVLIYPEELLKIQINP
jgi:hypothetical protein